MPRVLQSLLQRTALSVLLALTAAAGATAQEPPIDATSFTELTCTFVQGTQRSSDERTARRAEDELLITFTGIDIAGGVATIAAEDRSTGVAAIGADHAISFVEIMPSGNVAFTTVSLVDFGDELPAVHSRHVFDSLRPGYLATQLYGSCVARL